MFELNHFRPVSRVHHELLHLWELIATSEPDHEGTVTDTRAIMLYRSNPLHST